MVLLFTVLIGFTSYWSVFDADELEANSANKRPLLEEQQIRRGLIVARTERCLPATAARAPRRGSTSVSIPRASCSGIPWVTASWSAGGSGLEREYNDELTGKHDEFHTIFDELRGKEREGDDIVTNLDPQAQRTAVDALGGRAGAIVALEPATGRVRTMVSVPGYDPNSIPERFADLRRAPGSPLLNRTVAERISARLDLQGRDRDSGASTAGASRRSPSWTASPRRRSGACR